MVGRMSPSLEDYLEAVFRVADEGGARTTDVAAHLRVSKASVNQAVGLLTERGWSSKKIRPNLPDF